MTETTEQVKNPDRSLWNDLGNAEVHAKSYQVQLLEQLLDEAKYTNKVLTMLHGKITNAANQNDVDPRGYE